METHQKITPEQWTHRVSVGSKSFSLLTRLIQTLMMLDCVYLCKNIAYRFFRRSGCGVWETWLSASICYHRKTTNSDCEQSFVSLARTGNHVNLELTLKTKWNYLRRVYERNCITNWAAITSISLIQWFLLESRRYIRIPSHPTIKSILNCKHSWLFFTIFMEIKFYFDIQATIASAIIFMSWCCLLLILNRDSEKRRKWSFISFIFYIASNR